MTGASLFSISKSVIAGARLDTSGRYRETRFRGTMCRAHLSQPLRFIIADPRERRTPRVTRVTRESGHSGCAKRARREGTDVNGGEGRGRDGNVETTLLEASEEEKENLGRFRAIREERDRRTRAQQPPKRVSRTRALKGRPRAKGGKKKRKMARVRAWSGPAA